jgi:predicted nucleic acid-binding protein
MQKARNKEDQKKSLQYLKLMDIKTLSLTPNIGHRAMIYIEQFGLSHSLGAGDAIIAATAIENGMPLISCNEKHFKAIKELDLVVFKP